MVQWPLHFYCMTTSCTQKDTLGEMAPHRRNIVIGQPVSVRHRLGPMPRYKVQIAASRGLFMDHRLGLWSQ